MRNMDQRWSKDHKFIRDKGSQSVSKWQKSTGSMRFCTLCRSAVFVPCIHVLCSGLDLLYPTCYLLREAPSDRQPIDNRSHYSAILVHLDSQVFQKKLYQRWPQTDVEIFNYIVHANQGTRMGDKCGRQVGDKCKLSPKNPEWETSVGNKSGRQVWETSVGDKCGRQV